MLRIKLSETTYLHSISYKMLCDKIVEISAWSSTQYQNTEPCEWLECQRQLVENIAKYLKGEVENV